MNESNREPQPNREPLWVRCGDSTPRDRRNVMRLLWAVATWGICITAVSQLIKRQLLPTGPISWLTATLPTITGIVVVLAYVRYLRQADELQRMIHLRALALGFAVGWLALSCYPIFERVGAPAADASSFGALMAVSYALAVFHGVRRFW